MSDTQDTCPKCGSSLSEVIQTPSGKKLQRCSTGSWNKETKKTEGCDFVKWLQMEPITLDEKCPKCSAPLVMAFTRFGKKMKKCSTGGWDKDAKKATGCDYVQWITGSTEPLDSKCPECGEKLVLFTSSSGKKAEKCSTSGWDSVKKQATGCTYIKWLKAGETPSSSAGEEFLPPEPPN